MLTGPDSEQELSRPRGERLGGEPSVDIPDPLPALHELTRLLLAAETVQDVLRRVVVVARNVIPSADLVSITIRHQDGTLETPVGTAREAVELDQSQYRAGNGPCVDAADPAGPAYALSNDLHSETAWPTFASDAAAHGYKSVLSTALLPSPDDVRFTGALNVYSSRADAFDHSARDLAFLLSTHGSLALALAQTRGTLAGADKVAVDLRRAVESRTLIGQATGILMARRGLTADQAFEVLSRTSQNRNIKLARLAALLADRPDVADRI
jgi:hypothetical protein